MTIQLETNNRKAFDLVVDALEMIDEYRSSRDHERLNQASSKLRLAIDLDPAYFRAKYYEAVVEDLAGRSSSAVLKLEPMAVVDSPIQNEIRYNLGLAEYHGYGHAALDKAITQFTTVLASNPSATLELRANAGLAQAYAMHMIPPDPLAPDTTAITKYWSLVQQCSGVVQTAIDQTARLHLPWQKKLHLDSKTLDELSWTAHNAKGMALMYYSDYAPYGKATSPCEQKAGRAKLLTEALAELTFAEKSVPDDWANHCDMASANMRLGYVTGDDRHFAKALSLLQDVIDRLRPGYPFAKYEMGRVNRLAKRFTEAAALFKEVLEIPRDKRDISDRRPTIELERASKSDASFP